MLRVTGVTAQVDRLRAFRAQLCTLRNGDSSPREPKVVETEQVVNGFIRALRDTK